MADKLSITIALEGGAELQRQLAAIGKAGQQAFLDIAKAAEQAGGFKNLKPEEVTAKLKEMGIVGEDALNKIITAVESATRIEKLVSVVQTVEKGFAGLASAAAGFARALGPIGIIAALVGERVVKMADDAASAINKVDAEAIKLGTSIEKFDQLRQGFEKIGISAGAIGEGIAHVKDEIDKVNVERVAKAFKELEEGAKRGFGGIGTEQLNFLIETAGKIGPAAQAARAALEKLGAKLPEEAQGALERLGIAADDVATVIPQFVEKMRLLPDSAQRTADAISVLGPKLGVGLIQALRTGAVATDAFKANLQGLTQEQANGANVWEQNSNKMSAAWERFKTAVGGELLVTNTMRELTNLMNAVTTLLNASWPQWKAAFDNLGTAVFDVFAKLGELEVKLAGGIWDTFSSAGVAAWNAIGQATVSAVNAVNGFIDRMAAIVWDTISSAGVAAWNAITGAIQTAIDALLKFIGLRPSAPGGAEAAPGKAGGGMIGGRGSGTSDSNLAWLSRGEYIMPAWAVRKPGMLALLEALRRGGGIPGFADGGEVGGGLSAGSVRSWLRQVASYIGQVVSSLDRVGQATANAWTSHKDGMRSLMDGLFNSLTTVVTTIEGLAGSLREHQRNLMDVASRMQGNARGGLLGGRGSGTSDSNLAWVSRGEHIMPAGAVRQPGVLAFLEALRRSGGDLSRVLDRMGHFATGGLVGMPALAGGGLGGMSHVTIQFPGMPAVTGLRASSDVVEELRKQAAMAQVRSGGRKPSRYT